MSYQLSKNLLTAAILSVSLSSTAAIANEGCEETYGPWCNIANFLEQQEATAAGGPLFNSNMDLTNINLNSDEFGGQLEEQGFVTGWVSYSLWKGENDGETVAKLGKINFTISNEPSTLPAEFYNNYDNLAEAYADQENTKFTSDSKWVNVTASFEGKTFTFSAPFDSVEEGSFEDSLYASMRRFNFELSRSSDNGEYDMGVMRVKVKKYTGEDFGKIGAKFGYATPAADIAKLKNITGTTNYRVDGNGVYSMKGEFSDFGKASMDANMAVNFSAGSWSMNGTVAPTCNSEYFNVNFTSAGSVTGNTFKSNSINVNMPDAPIRVSANSTINGTFVSSGAQNLIGQADVTVTAIDNPNNTLNVKQVFTGEKVTNAITKPDFPDRVK